MEKIKNLLTKKPFYRIVNSGLEYRKDVAPGIVDNLAYAERPLRGVVMTQADFMEEYYPNGHSVTSEFFFPESYNYGKVITEEGEVMETMYREETFRVTIPIQAVITIQHLVHLCGNDIHFELTDSVVDDELQSRFESFQKGWLAKGMETRFYELVQSVKITGDGALVFYLDKGKIGCRRLSYLDGDTCYPHYDPVTGRMDVFARKYCAFDDKGETRVTYVEVWDDTYYARYKFENKGVKGVIGNLKEFFGMEGFVVDEAPKAHGFRRCPVVYHRDRNNGPCWANVQHIIEEIEVAMSYWAKACASTANDAYVMKGDDVEIKGDPLGRVRAFTMGKDDDVSLLEKKGGGDYFRAYVERLFKECFRGSFTIEVPELKAGDTPAAAIKLIYAPSLDLAICEAKEFADALVTIKDLFCQGYGIEMDQMSDYMELAEHIFAWIVPFVHENTAEVVSNLVQLAGSEILSKQTASEKSPYCTNAEWNRIVKERKDAEASDRLTELQNMM